MLAARRAPRPARRRCWSATCRSAPTRPPTRRRSPPRTASSRRRAATPSSSRAAARSAERARAIVARRRAGDGPRRPDAADRDRARRLPRPGPHGRARAAQVLDDALALQEAGCFAIVFEAIPAEVTDVIMEHMEIPVIGIGAGPEHRRPGARPARPARRSTTASSRSSSSATRTSSEEMVRGVEAYAEEVRTRALPRPRAHLRHRAGGAGAAAASSSPQRASTRSTLTTRSHYTGAPMAGCPSCSRPRSASSSTCSRRPARNIVRAAELLERMLEQWPDHGELAARRGRLRAGGRPDHARHHPAAEPDVRHADRPRGHHRARLRRWTTSSTSSRRSPTSSALYRIEAPMEQAQQLARDPPRGRRAGRRRDPAAAHASRTSATSRSRSTGSRTRATAIVREALASLFERGIDPMMVIRWKDIFERLEDAIDATETAANILEGIIIKNR